MRGTKTLFALLATVSAASAVWTGGVPSWCAQSLAEDALCSDAPDCCADHLPCMAPTGQMSAAKCSSTCSGSSCVRLDSHGMVDPYKVSGYCTINDDNNTAAVVTGGYGGTAYTVNSTDELQTALADTGSTVIMISGELDNSGNPSISLTVSGDTTIYGDPEDPAILKNIQLMVVGDNVIIQNLVIAEVVGVAVKATNGTTLIAKGAGSDGIALNGAENVWIDHCEFYSALWPAALYDISGDQKTDETDAAMFYGNAISVSNGATWITVSFCDFHDHWEVMSVGAADTESTGSDMRITVHHNYFHDVGSMTPLLVWGKAHHYNNYHYGATMAPESAIELKSSAEALIEGNYIENATYAFVNTSGYYNFGENTLVDIMNENEVEPTTTFDVPYSYDIDSSSILADRLPYLVGPNKLPEAVLGADLETLQDEEDDRALKVYADGFAGQNGGTTGGSLGRLVAVSTGLALNEALCNQSGDEPLIILINGTITLNNTEAVPDCTTSSTAIYLVGKANITLIGADDLASVLHQVGIYIANSSNIIIRNLYITDVKTAPGYPQSNGGKAISMDGSVSNVWIDHCTIKQYGDENRGYVACIAMGSSVQYVTVSYTAFENAGDGLVVGGSDLTLTLHHNYFWYVAGRTPELAGGLAHAYNNLFVGIETAGISVCGGGSAKIENSHFVASVNPYGSFCDGTGSWDVSGLVYESVSNMSYSDSDVLGGTSTGSVSISYDYFADPSECTMEAVLLTAGSNANLRIASGFCRLAGNPSDATNATVNDPYASKPAATPYTNDPDRQMPDGFATLGSGTTGGDGGDVAIVTTGTELLAAICGRSSSDYPITLWVDGTITLDNTNMATAAMSGDSCTLVNNSISLVDVSSVSILGFTANGGGAIFDGIGVYLRNASNIILQNLNVTDVSGTAVVMNNTVSNVWIDHCSLETATDSLLEMTQAVQYVTVSYTAFLNTGLGGTIGTDTTTGNVTFHHNYFWYVREDTPAVAAGTFHAYNNYYVGIIVSGINVMSAATAKVDMNYFQDSVDPITAAGALEVDGNVYSNVNWTSSTPAPAAAVNAAAVSSTTTVSIAYSYSAQTASCIADVVLGSAGASRGLVFGADACGLSGTATGSSLPDPTTVPEGITSGTPTPGTTPSPDGTTPSPSGTTPSPDGTTPSPSGTTPSPDGTTPSPSGTTPSPSGTTPSPSGTTPSPSGTTPSPSGTTPVPATTAPDGSRDLTPTPTTSGNVFRVALRFIVDLLVSEILPAANRLIAKLAKLFSGAPFTFGRACGTSLTDNTETCHEASELSGRLVAVLAGSTSWAFEFDVPQESVSEDNLRSVVESAGADLAASVSDSATFDGFTVTSILTPSPSGSDSDDDLTDSGIAGIVIGCVLFVGCIAAVVVFFMINKNQPPATGETEPVAEPAVVPDDSAV